jgi:TetR/AcrR family acrAB operon transcriptional repressor
MSRQESINTKERILEAAEKLFAEKGITKTSLLDLAQLLNISRGTLFYHYRAKEDLVFDVAEKHMTEINKSLIDTVKTLNNPDLKEITKLIIEKITADNYRSRIHHFLLSQVFEGNTRIREKLKNSYQAWIKLLCTECGALNPPVFISEKKAGLIIALIDGYIIQNTASGIIPDALFIAETIN